MSGLRTKHTYLYILTWVYLMCTIMCMCTRQSQRTLLRVVVVRRLRPDPRSQPSSQLNYALAWASTLCTLVLLLVRSVLVFAAILSTCCAMLVPYRVCECVCLFKDASFCILLDEHAQMCLHMNVVPSMSFSALCMRTFRWNDDENQIARAVFLAAACWTLAVLQLFAFFVERCRFDRLKFGHVSGEKERSWIIAGRMCVHPSSATSCHHVIKLSMLWQYYVH